MILKKIEINSFRNYQSVILDSFENINLVYGENGQGKTSFLEAIYYTALTQSFKAKSDMDCINYSNLDSQSFDISAEFENKYQDEEKVRIFYSKKEGKNLFLNSNKEKTYKNHIGSIPIVLIKPDDSKLTFGSPSDRRKFIDILLSQISPLYLDSLIKYKRLTKQKNALLSKSEKVNVDLLNTWNSELVKHGKIIVEKRLEIISEIQDAASEFYRKISDKNQKIEITYLSTFSTLTDIETQFSIKLNEQMSNELKQKKCLVGPHRDDLIFKIDQKSVGQFGSQGENKTYLISLKMAELEVLKNHISEKPILLFDDIFSELDQYRIEHLMEMITDVGQIFVTSTNDNIFGKDGAHKIHIKQGQVIN